LSGVDVPASADADPVPPLSLPGSVDIVPPLALPVFPIRIAEESRLGISIRRLAPTFAGEVTGVDCRRPQSPHQVAAIHAGMAEYAVLVFRDQPLTDEEQLRFTPLFGEFEGIHLEPPPTAQQSFGF
jgi:hypothetical protein